MAIKKTKGVAVISYRCVLIFFRSEAGPDPVRTLDVPLDELPRSDTILYVIIEDSILIHFLMP